MVPAGACLIATGATITYENGARVSTSFATNLEPETAARTDPMLYRIIKEANKAVQRKQTKKLPKYEYPVEVLTAARMNYISRHGQELTIRREDCTFIRALDQQRELKKVIYGSALLLSERAAAERAAAERATAERAAAERAAMEDAKAIKYELSERERKIVRELGRK